MKSQRGGMNDTFSKLDDGGESMTPLTLVIGDESILKVTIRLTDKPMNYGRTLKIKFNY